MGFKNLLNFDKLVDCLVKEYMSNSVLIFYQNVELHIHYVLFRSYNAVKYCNVYAYHKSN
jgi:hypothetical protein